MSSVNDDDGEVSTCVDTGALSLSKLKRTFDSFTNRPFLLFFFALVSVRLDDRTGDEGERRDDIVSDWSNFNGFVLKLSSECATLSLSLVYDEIAMNSFGLGIRSFSGFILSIVTVSSVFVRFSTDEHLIGSVDWELENTPPLHSSYRCKNLMISQSRQTINMNMK